MQFPELKDHITAKINTQEIQNLYRCINELYEQSNIKKNKVFSSITQEKVTHEELNTILDAAADFYQLLCENYSQDLNLATSYQITPRTLTMLSKALLESLKTPLSRCNELDTHHLDLAIRLLELIQQLSYDTKQAKTKMLIALMTLIFSTHTHFGAQNAENPELIKTYKDNLSKLDLNFEMSRKMENKIDSVKMTVMSSLMLMLIIAMVGVIPSLLISIGTATTLPFLITVVLLSVFSIAAAAILSVELFVRHCVMPPINNARCQEEFNKSFQELYGIQRPVDVKSSMKHSQQQPEQEVQESKINIQQRSADVRGHSGAGNCFFYPQPSSVLLSDDEQIELYSSLEASNQAPM